MGCATGVVRIMVFVLNFMCTLVGLTLLTVGVLYYIPIAEYNLTDNNYTLIPILVISVGATVFLISFLGCCGVYKQNECMLITYAVILLALFVSQLAIGVIGFLKVQENGGDVNKTFESKMYDAFVKYETNENVNITINKIQTELKCCGVKNVDDYKNSSMTIPASCCGNLSKGDTCSSIGAFADGCAPKILNLFFTNIEILTYVVLGIATVELVGSLFAVCLVNSLRNDSRRRYK